MSAKRPKSSLRDRTQEYRSLSTALRKRQQTNGAAITIHHTATSAQSKAFYVEFSKQAGAIGNDIQGTTRLLEKLATLARGKTIFDDKTVEINQLTTQVKQRIANINGKIMSLQTLQRQQNGAAAGSSSNGGRQATEHHSNVVMSLQSQLATTSSVFKDVLELRSESLKESGTRKEQFIGSSAAATTAGNVPFRSTGVRNRRGNDRKPNHSMSANSTHHVDSPLYQAERKKPPPPPYNPSDISNRPNGSNGFLPPYPGANNTEDFVALSLPDMDLDSSSQSLLTQQQQQQDQSSAYLDSRSEAITSIESTISELGSIFQQLAQMVSEQRDVVQRIDANVENIDMNIGAAQSELLRYYSNISSNRWLMAKIFMVILVFVFLLVTFV